MQPKNFGIVVQNDHEPALTINRIEISSNFDFEKRISQIMVGEPMTYPHKKDFLYVNVYLCITWAASYDWQAGDASFGPVPVPRQDWGEEEGTERSQRMAIYKRAGQAS
jgi:hypothetical protein